MADRSPAYQEFDSGHGLRSAVDAVWVGRDSQPDPATPTRILPDGCADVILEYGRGGQQGTLELRDSFVVGQMTTAVLVDPVADRVFVGIRLRPHCVGVMLRADARELVDRLVPLDDVWNDASRPLDSIRQIPDQSHSGIACAVLTAFSHRLSRAAEPPAEVRASVAMLAADHGRTPIARVAAALGFSRQHLARQFATYVGLSPKELARVFRLQALIAAARSTRGASRTWSALAHSCGYSDHAHMTSDFRRLVGIAPAEWDRQRVLRTA